MQIKPLNPHAWGILSGDRILAEVHTDYLSQVEYVLFNSRNSWVRRAVKALVLNHAVNYLIHRNASTFGGIMRDVRGNSAFSPADSNRLMNFDLIPEEIKNLPDDEVMRSLQGVVEILETRDEKDTAEMLVNDILSSVESATGVKIRFESSLKRPEFLRIIAENGKFRFWHNLMTPKNLKDNKNLHHIVPDYHPEANPDKYNALFLLNGDTDYCIDGGDVIKNVYPPSGSSEDDKKLSSSFSRVGHPYFVEGLDFSMTFSPVHLRTRRGFDSFVAFIWAALEYRGGYVSVSGGFCSPYMYPSNLRLGIEPYGSENSMFWEYEVLEKEGKLDTAIIPKRFLDDGWLNAYVEAKKRGRVTEKDIIDEFFQAEK